MVAFNYDFEWTAKDREKAKHALTHFNTFAELLNEQGKEYLANAPKEFSNLGDIIDHLAHLETPTDMRDYNFFRKLANDSNFKDNLTQYIDGLRNPKIYKKNVKIICDFDAISNDALSNLYEIHSPSIHDAKILDEKAAEHAGRIESLMKNPQYFKADVMIAEVLNKFIDNMIQVVTHHYDDIKLREAPHSYVLQHNKFAGIDRHLARFTNSIN